MRFVLVGDWHWNVDHIAIFRWNGGELMIWSATGVRYRYTDPDKKLYNRLCTQLGVMTAEEVNRE